MRGKPFAPTVKMSNSDLAARRAASPLPRSWRNAPSVVPLRRPKPKGVTASKKSKKERSAKFSQPQSSAADLAEELKAARVGVNRIIQAAETEMPTAQRRCGGYTLVLDCPKSANGWLRSATIRSRPPAAKGHQCQPAQRTGDRFLAGSPDWPPACPYHVGINDGARSTDVCHEKTIPVESRSSLPVRRCSRGVLVGGNRSRRGPRPGSNIHQAGRGHALAA